MASTPFDSEWQLYDASKLLEEISGPLKEAGFFVGITGSVLMKGYSKHDLDIIVYPAQCTPETDFELARTALLKVMTCFKTVEKVHTWWRKKNIPDQKYVEIWVYNKKRVDVFFLR